MMLEGDSFYPEFISERCCEVIEIQRKLPPEGINIIAYAPAQSIKAVLIKEEHSQNSNSQHCKLIYLIPGSYPPPEPGDRVIRNNEYYELAKVEICRDFNGNIVASKCSIS